MVAKISKDLATAAHSHGGHAGKVLEYCLFQQNLMERSRHAKDYSPAEWLGLKQFCADDFRRVGNFKEIMDFAEMVAFLQEWSPTIHWEASFKRVTENDDVVWLELEERLGDDAAQTAVNSVTVYEFGSDGKIRHLDVYLQAEPAG